MSIINYFGTAFIGSVFGCAVSYLIYRENGFRTAKFELIEHVRFMIHDLLFNKSKDPIFSIINSNIVTLHISYLKLRAAYILPCNRSRIDTAWRQLVGYNENKSNRPGLESMSFPTPTEDAIQRFSDFLKKVE